MVSKSNEELTAKEYTKIILIKLDLIYQELVAMRKEWHTLNEKYKANKLNRRTRGNFLCNS